MNVTLFIIAIILIFRKWIVFAFFMIPLHIWVRSRKKREQSDNNGMITLATLSEGKPASFLRRTIGNVMLSYYRYSQFQVGRIPSHHVRNWLYKNVYGVTMAKGVVVYFGAEIRGSWNLTLGKGCIVGDQTILDARRDGIDIGENVNISSNVSFYTDSHDYNDPYFRASSEKVGGIKVGSRAWIGPNSVILHGISIGEGAVVAVGSVVKKDVPPYTVVGGIPARKIGIRNQNLKYQFCENTRCMFY